MPLPQHCIGKLLCNSQLASLSHSYFFLDYPFSVECIIYHTINNSCYNQIHPQDVDSLQWRINLQNIHPSIVAFFYQQQFLPYIFPFLCVFFFKKQCKLLLSIPSEIHSCHTVNIANIIHILFILILQGQSYHHTYLSYTINQNLAVLLHYFTIQNINLYFSFLLQTWQL